MVTVPMDEITEESNLLLRNIILAALAGPSLGSASIDVGSIARPVVAVSKQLSKLAALDFRDEDSTLSVNRDDEIDDEGLASMHRGTAAAMCPHGGVLFEGVGGCLGKLPSPRWPSPRRLLPPWIR
ncbi:hypothetical protein MASR2M17_19650 [Aminivibrio sp.]